MLRLTRFEVEGFGPFADPQTIEFPRESGVVVIYGENMRGKTTLLNAIRYAFFGYALGRGSRKRTLHSLTNRERAANGEYGFTVSLSFEFDNQQYELVRECAPKVKKPEQDADYTEETMLRCGQRVLGPQERDSALKRIFPEEISRFFLFDGELLQEYEELVLAESDVGPEISAAIERILGVPILKAARSHISELAQEADQEAAREASRHRETEGIGNALKQSIDKRDAHVAEQKRKQQELEELTRTKTELEAKLAANRRYADILERRDTALKQAKSAKEDKDKFAGEIRAAMRDAWRTMLKDPIRKARDQAQADLEAELANLRSTLQRKALDAGTCDICFQDVPASARGRIERAVADAASTTQPRRTLNRGDLASLQEADNGGEIRQLARQLEDAAVAEKAARDLASDLDGMLKDADPGSIRTTQATYREVSDQIAFARQAIDAEGEKILEQDANIERLRQKLRQASPGDLGPIERKIELLRAAEDVFHRAVATYKVDLRTRVEASATELFLAMTTERTDYAGLRINDEYGLSIIHQDGQAEEARSAGAEHVVALALMGALQKNAPLRGPIVMDSPFGRLDEQHTSNVVGALHRMADQVVLLVYESEVGRNRARQLLRGTLRAEFELERVNSRRTNVRKVQ
jgi:DNA sulfur modification protein DndD